jgi:hypothetical protein
MANCAALMDTQRPATLTNVDSGQTITGNWRILVTDIATSSPHSSTIQPMFANVWHFMLTAQLPTTPSTPVSLSPSGNSGVPRRSTLRWSAVPAVTSYDLQVAADDSFKTVVLDTSVADTTVTLSTPLHPSMKYYWHVAAVDIGLKGTYSAVDSFTTGTGIDAVDEQTGVPAKFALLNNYPNPFNPSTTIKISLAHAGVMSLRIYDVLGQLVKVVDEGYKPAGMYTYNVDMERFSSGVYFYTLRQDVDVITRKMLFLK